MLPRVPLSLGQTKLGETLNVIPNPKKDEKLTAYQKLKKRAQCTSRAAMEPIMDATDKSSKKHP